MKFETTYTELSNIYAYIGKAELRIQNYKDAETAYNQASDAYRDSDYLLSKGMEMSAALETRDKAEKAVLKVYSKLVDLLGLDRSSKYGEEAYYIKESKSINGMFLYIAKREALRLAKTLSL